MLFPSTSHDGNYSGCKNIVIQNEKPKFQSKSQVAGGNLNSTHYNGYYTHAYCTNKHGLIKPILSN